jgi:hypothetical protein
MTSSAVSAAEAAVANSRTTERTEMLEAEVNYRESDSISSVPVRLIVLNPALRGSRP